MLRWLALPAGALVGYLFYLFVGCRTGVCPLTQNPWSSAALGMALAWFLVLR